MNNDIVVKFKNDVIDSDIFVARTQAGLTWCELNLGEPCTGWTDRWQVGWAYTARAVMMAKARGLSVGTVCGETL
jgi:hypothetical protein